jgi:hypothetical protein
MAAMAGRKPFCADVSRANAEPLGATASRVESWILVEYRGVWSRELLAESGLSNAVKSHLREQVNALPRSRLLFVRRPERRLTPGFAVFVARSRERDAELRGLEVPDYDDLRRLDLTADPGEPVRHPLLVVCTHGKRDRCCSLYGRPLYDELRAEAGEEWIWQSSHVGGDRFAGNLVCLPEGLYFGRVGRADVWGLLDEYLAGRIDLAHYRGRSCYEFAVQAAERRVREDTGVTGIDDLVLAGADRSGEGAWRVEFVAAGELHEVDVVEELGELTYLTCDAAIPRRPRRFLAASRRVRATA